MHQTRTGACGAKRNLLRFEGQRCVERGRVAEGSASVRGRAWRNSHAPARIHGRASRWEIVALQAICGHLTLRHALVCCLTRLSPRSAHPRSDEAGRRYLKRLVPRESRASPCALVELPRRSARSCCSFVVVCAARARDDLPARARAWLPRTRPADRRGHRTSSARTPPTKMLKLLIAAVALVGSARAQQAQAAVDDSTGAAPSLRARTAPFGRRGHACVLHLLPLLRTRAECCVMLMQHRAALSQTARQVSAHT